MTIITARLVRFLATHLDLGSTVRRGFTIDDALRKRGGCPAARAERIEPHAVVAALA